MVAIAESSPFAFVDWVFQAWLPAIRYLVPPPPPGPAPSPSVCSTCCCPCATAFGLGLQACARRWSRSRSAAVARRATAVAPRFASYAHCSASWSLPRRWRTYPPAATARFCYSGMAPAYAATQASTCAAGGGFAAEGWPPDLARSLGALHGRPTLPLDPPLLELHMEEPSSPPPPASTSTTPPTSPKCLRCSSFARVNIWSQA